jgi:hypothetical protein
MPRRLLHHIRSNAIGYAALFVSLGGTSYAAIAIPAGSVGTRQLRNGAVTGSKLAKKSVSAANLNSSSIAGHVADWAQVRADGHVTTSSPKASVVFSDPTRGLYQVSWHRSIPSRCIAVANPVNVAPITSRASAETFGPTGKGRAAYVLVSTFDSAGNNVPESVNLVVVCP